MKILKYILSVGLFASIYNCSDDLPQPKGSQITVGYIDELQGRNSLRFAVDDNGGEMELTPRISNLSEGNTSFTLQISPEVLKKFNEENGTKYQLLPENVFNLINKKTGDKGQSLNVNLNKGEYGASIGVKVESIKDLPLSTSYAIPVLLTNIDTDNFVKTKEATSGVILLDRKFTTNVLRMVGSIKATLKDPAKDKKYKDWTAQYSFMPALITENFGLMYPNQREGHGEFYQTLYGGSTTLFTPSGGKVQFNQAKFKDFKFEANKWYHMALSFKDGYLSVYVNGELAYYSNWGGNVENWPKIIVGNTNFNGYLREVRFWNRALSATEVNSTLYFADPAAEGLELYLPLNKETKQNNVAKGTLEDYDITFESGATESSVNYETEVTFP